MTTKDKTVRASLINLAIAKNDVLLRSKNLLESVKASHRNNLIEAYKESFRRDDAYEQAKALLKAVKATGTAKGIAEAKVKLDVARHWQLAYSLMAKCFIACEGRPSCRCMGDPPKSSKLMPTSESSSPNDVEYITL
jgi:hemoglobin-like flavoprotein